MGKTSKHKRSGQQSYEVNEDDPEQVEISEAKRMARSESTKCKRKVLERRSVSRESSHDSSSSRSSSQDRKTKKHKKSKKKDDKKSKKKKKKRLKKLKKQLEKVLDETKSISRDTDPELVKDGNVLARQRSTDEMKPMTKDEWEKTQQETKYITDETGRRRLVRGSGEILEEIVSKERQAAINKQATAADGVYFMKKTGQL